MGSNLHGVSPPLCSPFTTLCSKHTCAHTHSTTCSDFGFLFLTLSLFSQSVHVHECTHLCTHIVMYTACTPCICHTYMYSTYTYSTLALLRKWNLVHNTYIHSCTVHLYACILMKNIKHVYTHSHTHMYIARKVYSKLVNVNVLSVCVCVSVYVCACVMKFSHTCVLLHVHGTCLLCHVSLT